MSIWQVRESPPSDGGRMSLAAHVNFAKLFRIEQILAEEEGFEPPCTFRRKRFSRPPVSTTHPFLHLLFYRTGASRLNSHRPMNILMFPNCLADHTSLNTRSPVRP